MGATRQEPGGSFVRSDRSAEKGRDRLNKSSFIHHELAFFGEICYDTKLKECAQMEGERTVKKAIVIVLIVVLVLALAVAGYVGYRYWYNETHIFIEEAVYEEDATYIDLRGTGASMEHYLQLKAVMPECQIDWDVPFQGKPTDCNTQELTVTALTEEDLEMLSWFPKLRKIDATACEDLSTLELLTMAYPDLEVTYFVDLGSIVYPPDTAELTLEEGTYEYARMLENLVHLPQLTSLSFPNTTLTLEQLDEIVLMYPGIRLSYTVSFRGQEMDPAITELDLSDLTPEEVEQVARELKFFPDLQTVELMDASDKSSLSLTDVQTLQEAAPGATFHYTFTFYNKKLSTTDTEVEYRNTRMRDSDEEQIRQILDIMDSCTKFTFNNCHISNDVMASIRDTYRDRTKIVWRVFFGNGGSCLTDREVIKMVYGLTNANSVALKYCEDAKYIDFGHNESLTDISFVAHMPKLEAIILSGSPIRDLTPFEGNTSLYFLEIAYCGYITDLSPLSGCTNLGMLNFSYCDVTDLSPIDALPITNLTFVKTPVSDEEVARYSELHPDCWVVDAGPQPYGKGWRYDENGDQAEYYKKLASKEIFNYANTSDTQW